MTNIINSQSGVFNTTDENSFNKNIFPVKKQASNIAGSQPLALRDITNQTHAKKQAIPLKKQANNTNSQPLALRDVTNLENVNSQGYSFRETTHKKHAESHSVPFEKQTRTILKPGATPSIVVTNENRALDPTLSKIKAQLRVHLYFIDAIIEVTHNISLDRAKTALQGTSAPKGCQAAHACLAPNKKDRHTTNVIERVVEVGVTPTKTEPFLRSRINLSTPEKTTLDQNHTDENFVKHFITKRLPKDGIHSILTGTQYSWNCNSTFENPDESNQYDSRLEKTIATTVKELQELRLKGEDTPEESTEKLVAWLMDYYEKSIANITKQTELLEKTHDSLDRMRIFEQKHLHSQALPTEEFDAYLKDVGSFLEHHTTLMEKKVGCPTCKDLKYIRNDFSFLKKLVSTENPEDYFLNNRRHLIKQEPFSAKNHLQKFDLYLLEAKTQMKAVDVFTEACTIQGMRTAIFGIYENGVRRPPTEHELKKQVNAISKPLEKTQTITMEVEETSTQENPKLPNVENKVARKIKFESSELEERDSKKIKLGH